MDNVRQVGSTLQLIVLAALVSACGATTQGVQPESELPDEQIPDVNSFERAMRTGFEADVADFVDGTRYEMDVSISARPFVITGSERVRYVNDTGATLNMVVFRLYPNFLAGREVLMVRDVQVDGSAVEPSLSVGGSVLEVPLAKSLAPGKEVEIEMAFELTVPSSGGADPYGRLGDVGGVLSLPSFFPMLSVYQVESGDWWREPPDPDGDPVFSESALYEVDLTVPSEMVVATVGQTLDRTDNDDGTTRYHIVSGPVRDFAIYMSEDFEVTSDSADGLTVNVYSLPGDEETDAFVVERTLFTVGVFDRDFGMYPYAELDVVETHTGASGIEYPGLYVLAESIWNHDNSFLQIVIAHETAHQWWYGLVGNDQVGQPWLDEGLAQYSVIVYWREAEGEGTAEGTTRFYEQTVENFVNGGGEDLPVGMPVDGYSGVGYRTIVYFKAPLFFIALEDTYGQGAMDDFLHAYFDAHKYGVATSPSLRGVAKDVFGDDAGALFDEWVVEGS